jgi:prophage regulatory protein
MSSSDRILPLAAVLARTGLTRSTLYRKVASGSFSRQLRISHRCAGWRESDINAWYPIRRDMRSPTRRNPTLARLSAALRRYRGDRF